jgi:hypothetical protein
MSGLASLSISWPMFSLVMIRITACSSSSSSSSGPNNISNEPVKEKYFFLYFWDRQIFTWAERLVYNDAGLVAQTSLVIRKRKAFVVIYGTSPRADKNLNKIHYQITRRKCL